MDKSDALKARIAALAPQMPFYLIAEHWSHPAAPEGTCSLPMAGECFDWTRQAKRVLEDSGLEAMPMCTGYDRRMGANHAFLLVRDPQSGAVVYYDPSAEQFGVIGAHKRAFTRPEIDAHNRQCNAYWLDKPILFKDWKIDGSWRDHWEEFESIRHIWGSEIHYDIPRTGMAGHTNYGTGTRFFGL